MMLHGQAIAAGMICEAWLSNKLAGMADDELDDLSSLIKSHFNLNRIEENAFDKISRIVNYDKKKSGKGIVFLAS